MAGKFWAAETAALLREMGYRARVVASAAASVGPYRTPGHRGIEAWSDVGPRCRVWVEYLDGDGDAQSARDHGAVVDLLTRRHFHSMTFWSSPHIYPS